MSSLEKRFSEVTAGLFWGNKNKMESVTPQEVKQVKDYIKNTRDYVKYLSDSWKNIENIARSDKSSLTNSEKKVFKELTEDLVRQFPRVVNVFQNHGLWPTYDGDRFKSTHDKFVGLVKTAGEFKPNGVGVKVLKFLEDLPDVLKQAVQDLKEEPDDRYLDGLYRLVYDALFEGDGVLAIAEEIVSQFGNEVVPPESIKEDKGERNLESKITWMGTKGIDQIKDAIASSINRGIPPEGDPDREAFEDRAHTRVGKAVDDAWESSTKKILDEYGFKTTGVFDRKLFESKFKRAGDAEKMASSGGFKSLSDMVGEFKGTYKAFLQAVELYEKEGSHHWRDQVVDTYHDLVLGGDTNLYKKLKDFHKGLSSGSKSPDTPDKVTKGGEWYDLEEDESDDTPSDSTPESGGGSKPSKSKPKGQGKSDTPSRDEEKGSLREDDGGYDSSALTGMKDITHELAKLTREKGNYARAFSEYTSEAFPIYFQKGANKEELDHIIGTVMKILEGRGLKFSKDLINQRPVLEALFHKQASPHSQFYSLFRDLMSQGVTDPFVLADELGDYAGKVKGWAEAFYKDFKKRAAKYKKYQELGKSGPSSKENEVEVTTQQEETPSKELDKLQEAEKAGEFKDPENEKAKEVARVLEDHPEEATDDVSKKDIDGLGEIAESLKAVDRYLANSDNVEESTKFVKKILEKAHAVAARQMDNEDISDPIKNQIAKVLKHLVTHGDSVKSVEDLEKVVGDLGDEVDDSLEQIQEVLDEVSATAKAQKSTGWLSKLPGKVNDLVAKLPDIIDSIRYGEGAEVLEEDPDEPSSGSNSDRSEEKYPEDNGGEGDPEGGQQTVEEPVKEDKPEDKPKGEAVKEPEENPSPQERGEKVTAQELHSALVQKLPATVEPVAESLASHLIYGRGVYYADKGLYSLGLDEEAYDIVRAVRELKASGSAPNRRGFVESVKKFMSKAKEVLDEEDHSHLVEDLSDLGDEIEDFEDIQKQVKKMASTSIQDRVMEMYLGKKDSWGKNGGW